MDIRLDDTAIGIDGIIQPDVHMTHASESHVGKVDKHFQIGLFAGVFPGLTDHASFVLMGGEIPVEIVNQTAGNKGGDKGGQCDADFPLNPVAHLIGEKQPGDKVQQQHGGIKDQINSGHDKDGVQPKAGIENQGNAESQRQQCGKAVSEFAFQIFRPALNGDGSPGQTADDKP